MIQLRALLRIQMSALAAMFTGTANGTKKASRRSLAGKGILLAVLYLYVAGVFVFLFAGVFGTLAEICGAAGLGTLYFMIVFLLITGLMLIGSVFFAKSMLFEAKDNDLLLAMPIPPRVILLSRILPLYLMNLLYGLTAALPAVFLWIRQNGVPGAVPVLSFILLFLAVGLFALGLNCLLGWALAKVSKHIRRKTLVSVAAVLLFLGAYYYFFNYFMGEGLQRVLAYLAENGGSLTEKLGAALPLYWIGSACVQTDIPAFLGALAFLLAVFAAVYAVLSRTFLRTATASSSEKKEVYRAGNLRTSSPFFALLRRENARILNSSVYLLNAGLGVLFLIAAGVMAVIRRSALLETAAALGMDAETDGARLCVLLAVGGCLILSMCMFMAPSVSLEGRTLWILRAMPVSARDILRSKLCFHLLWTVPGCLLFSLGSCIAVSGGNAGGCVMLFLLPLLFSAASGALGLVFGVLMPNFEWTSETQAVKQGIAVLSSMFGSMVLAGLPLFVLLLTNPPVSAFFAGCAVLYAATAAVCYRWLMTSGAARFEAFAA